MRTPTPAAATVALSLLLLLLAFAPPVSAASAEARDQPAPSLALDGSGPWVVRVHTLDRDLLRTLDRNFDLWAVYRTKGYALVQVDRAAADGLLRAARDGGFSVAVDARRSGKLQRDLARLRGVRETSRPNRVTAADQTGGIPGYPCYRTVEQTFADAAALAALRPDLATWQDVGDSWEKADNPANGHDMRVLRLTRSAVPGPKPVLFLSCAIHAREYTTAELCTRLAELLVGRYDSDPDVTWLLDEHEVHLMLHANPDGRRWAEAGYSWRKNTNNDYCSDSTSRGADLNRNFEFQWGCCGGSSSWTCSSTYRGPSAASEPEIQALQAYVRSVFPDQRPGDTTTPAPDDATGVAIDVHSHGGLVLWSWGFTSTPAPNATQLATLGRKLAWFNGYDPGPGTDLYVTDGSSKDFYYGDRGVAAYVFELGTEFFESCAYFELQILEDNLAALLHAARLVRTPLLTPAGPDALDAAVPLEAVAVGDPVTVSAILDDTRFSTLGGVEPSQNVVAADVYVDLPPWQAGAVAVALQPTNGVFDSSVEAVDGPVDTTGLAPGRHTLYVQGTDADGNTGAVDAVFLHVIDPATAPTLTGTVVDADSLAPLAATVRVGNLADAIDFETTTDASGVYSLRLPAGTYAVTAVAAGHQSATVEGVVTVDGQTTVQDLHLAPFSGLWADDAEAGNPGWTADAPWAISTEAAFSPTHAWSDSPGTLYADNANAALTTPVLDLRGYTGVNLTFRHRYDLEQGFDFGRVEISTDGGSLWSEVAVYSGLYDSHHPEDWAWADLDLTALDGQQQARLRFRLDADDSLRRDGWYLDDVLLRGVFDGNNPPAVAITAPQDGAAFDVGETVTFTGTASDVEDGDLSAGLVWTSSLDGAIGSGASFQTSALSEGQHTITASVTDSGGAPGSDRIGVKIGGCSVEVTFDDGSPAGWFNDPASTCTTGAFVVATPNQVSDGGVVTQVGGDHTSGTGNAFFSALNSSAGTDDVDGGECRVESPVYPVTRASDVSIWTFHGQRDGGDDPGGDGFMLEMSTDGGVHWTVLQSYGDQTVNAAWGEVTTTVPADSDVQFRVRVSDGPSAGDLVEGGVDDLFICPSAPECTVHGDCDDGLFCNGAETCDGGVCLPGSDPCPGESCDEVNDVCVAAPTAQLEWGTVSAGGTPVTVHLTHAYTHPVVVTAVQYDANTTPLVPRLTNVTGSSFDVYLQNPSNGAVAMDTVSWLVVEEGSWTVDGVRVDAWTYTSTVTDGSGSWVGEAQSYPGTFTNPVVLGQVMSSNAPDWSVFWNQGASRTTPPTAGDLRTGKEVGEDGDVTRADETVGVIVFETGHGTLGGVELEARLGSDSIQGVTNNPPYDYTFSTAFAGAPTVALVTQAAMDGGNGGWAQIHGPTMATATTLYLSIDEDQIGDSERNHTNEQVGYVVFATPGTVP